MKFNLITLAILGVLILIVLFLNKKIDPHVTKIEVSYFLLDSLCYSELKRNDFCLGITRVPLFKCDSL